MADAMKELRRPFPADAIEWKPGSTTQAKDKAMAMAYIDARAVMDRLDAVLGSNWSVRYEDIDGGVRCFITALGQERSDVGEPGDGPLGKGPKATHSDALKRAAVAWGVGRFLYSLDAVWVPYDADKKRITPQGKALLAQSYEAWLKRPTTIEAFGEVMGHAPAPVETDEPGSDEGTATQAGVIPKASNGRPPSGSGGTVQQKLLRAIQTIPDHTDRRAFCEGQGFTYSQTAILDLPNAEAQAALDALIPAAAAV